MTHYVELKDLKNINEPMISPDSKPGIESNENIEIGGRIDSLRLCVASKPKKIIRYTLYVITCFLTYLFSIWVPKLYILLTFNDCNEEEAEYVIIYGAEKNIEIVPLIRESTSSRTLKVFYYRLFKYYFDESKRMFCLAQFHIETMSCNQIHDQLGRGLNQDQVGDNSVFYGKNQTGIPRKSILDLFVSEILSPFYVFQVYSFIIWALDDYLAYASVILLFSIISITITLVETIQTRNKLQQMSFYEIPMTVLRPVMGEEKKFVVSSSELVPGDLIEIPEDVQMPCDAILLNGSCIMNEAMLTGESIPVIKSSLPYNNNLYNPKEDKQYTLFAGTKCIQTRYYKGNAVLGLVTLTGFTTVKGELIRTMLFPKPSDFKFYADAFKFMVILASMAVCGFLIDLPSFLDAAKDDPEISELIFIKACEIVTVTVPPALPTCMQIGISVALTRLLKKNIYCISPNKINEVGKINVMCFDKTGTLTEDGLDLFGVRPITFDKKKDKLSFVKLVQDLNKLNPEIDMTFREAELQNYIALEGPLTRNSLYANTKMFPCEQLLEIMASCHTLTYVNNKLIGDPLDIKMFESTKWSLEENDQQNYDVLVSAIVKSPLEKKRTAATPQKQKEIGIIRKFEFSSKLQRMSVIVKNLSEHDFKVHTKGSPEKIRELCRSESVPDNFHSILQRYTEEGYRVLACASKVIHVNYKRVMEGRRDDIEKNLTFVGFLIMENRLKNVTTDIIDTLHSANIRTIMVTGDNVLTAISVARQCNIVGQNQRIFLGDIDERDNQIIWKDFEFSNNQLNQSLEPELDFGKLPLLLSPPSKETSSKKSLDLSQENMYVEMLALRTKSKSARNLSEDRKQSLELEDGEEEDTLEIKVASKEKIQQQRKSTRKNSNINTSTPFYNMHDQENYCIAVTGKVFSLILNEAEVKKNLHYIHILDKLLKKCLVFARMHPDEKALMIKQMMQDPQNIVGMCGDGANDVGALKTANMGVSLSEAEASIAAPFTSKIQDISCIPILLKQGRSALATSFQAFKYMALYSIIQFTTITILYYHLVELTNVHYYHIDIIIILFLSATMAMSDTNNELTIDTPTSRLISVQVLTSVIGSGIIQILFQVFAYNLLTYQSWYDPKFEGFSDKIASPENTTLYIVSIYQYCVVALAFIVGRPFRKPFYTNVWFSISLVVLMIVNLLLTYNPFNWAMYDPELGIEVEVPSDWIRKLTFIIIINSIATMACEHLLVKKITLKWKEYKSSRALK